MCIGVDGASSERMYLRMDRAIRGWPKFIVIANVSIYHKIARRLTFLVFLSHFGLSIQSFFRLP